MWILYASTLAACGPLPSSGSATALSLPFLFAIGPAIVLRPVSNAIVGRGNPQYDVGDFQPTIVTYSHHHPDHDRGATFYSGHGLDGLDALTLEGITLQPVLTTEKTREDNTSYLITYKGFTILHLGDAQGDISRIAQEDVRQHLKELFPGPVDLLLVPIGWTQDILQEAEASVALLQPRRVIPIHYWSPGEKAGFLALLADRNQTAGASYQVQKIGDAEYDIWIDGAEVPPIQVISLEPARSVHS